METGRNVALAQASDWRGLGAGIAGAAAARGEGAAWRPLERIGHLAGNARQAPARRCRVQAGQGREKTLRVGMGAVPEDRRRRTALGDGAGIHDRDPVGHLGNHAQVVGDQDQRHALLRRDAGDQVEDLGLDGHVQGGRRLVGDQDLRPAGQRHGDDHPLALPARELMRIEIGRKVRRRQADPVEKLTGPRRCLGLGQTQVQAQALGHLIADGSDRVEGRHGFLEDHGHAPAAQATKLLFAQLQQVTALQGHPAAGTRRRRQQAHDGQRRHGLAAAGLADQAQALAGLQAQRDLAQDLCPTLGRRDLDAELLDLEQSHHGSPQRTRRRRGSRTSRRPSPSRFRPSTVSAMAQPGKTAR